MEEEQAAGHTAAYMGQGRKELKGPTTGKNSE